MRVQRSILVIVLLVGFACVTGFFTLSREPSYQGIRLSQWLDRQIERQRAGVAIRQIGGKAVPYLVAMMKQKDSTIKIRLHRLLAKQSIVHVHFSWAGEQHERAVRGFEALGLAGKDAMLSLIAVLNDANAPAAQMTHAISIRPSAPAAARALEALGLDIVLAAIPLVTNEKSQRWLYHGLILHPIYGNSYGSGSDPAQDVALMGRVLDQCTFADIRADAAQCLGSLREWPEVAVPLLTRRLILDTDTTVKAMAAYALSCFGRQATSAVPALLRARSVKGVGEAAIAALNVIDPAAVVDFDTGLRKEPAPEDLPLPLL